MHLFFLIAWSPSTSSRCWQMSFNTWLDECGSLALDMHQWMTWWRNIPRLQEWNSPFLCKSESLICSYTSFRLEITLVADEDATKWRSVFDSSDLFVEIRCAFKGLTRCNCIDDHKELLTSHVLIPHCEVSWKQCQDHLKMMSTFLSSCI